MNRKLPPNLYERKYKTRGGYTRVLFYCRFKCWDGKRRTFRGIPDFNSAKAELIRLLELDRQRYDFDREDVPGAAKQPQGLFTWIEKFLDVKSGKLSAKRDKISAEWIKEFFGDCPLEDIIHSRMLEYRKSRAVSDTTKNRELAFLRGVLYMAKRDGQLQKLPAIPFEEEHNERTRTATAEELRKILKAMPANYRDIIAMLKETGFRIGEVLRLTPGDLNAFTQSIDMKRIRSKGGFKRALPMSPTAWRILETRARGRKANERLFPISRVTIYKKFVEICREQSITGLWMHDIRGTFVTEKERQGWPRKIIREYTGHRSELVFNRYSRATDDDLRAFIGAQSATQWQQTRRAGLKMLKGRELRKA